MKPIFALIILGAAMGAAADGQDRPPGSSPKTESPPKAPLESNKNLAMTNKVVKTDAEWQRLLTPEQYRVTRKKATERAFTGQYWNNKEHGIYHCVCCGNELFSSETKFESGTGWPSFWAPMAAEKVKSESDSSFFMRRTEVLCSRCDAHLGHVFDDGPKPTNQRYCINSAALKFSKAPPPSAK